MSLDRFFARAEIPAGLDDELRALAREGTIVFVMRSAGWLNLSFIRWLLRRLGMPALGAAIGLGHFFRLLIGRRSTLAALRGAIGAQAPALIFLRRPSVFRAKGIASDEGGGGGRGGGGGAGAGAQSKDPFRALCELQRAGGRPLYLVPILYIWSRRPKRLKPSLIDIVLGSPEAPSALATSIAFLRNYQRAFVRMGRPIALADFLSAESRRGAAAGVDVQLTARKVRGALYYHLSREARAVIGPPFKSPRRIREEVLRDRALQETIAAEAARRARPTHEIDRQADRMVREIAARMSPLFFEIIRPLVVWICTRLYQGIELDEEGIAEVRQAANSGGLVLCPSHKSHMDYVILTLMFYQKGLLPPHVAAGINLAFWPFGAIARWCGGFFIRRSFKGDRLYSAVVRAYVKRLMRDGFPQEFFIEGGRSRTGKLAFPKTGLLAMEVDAWHEGAERDLFFVPVAIDYEKLPEGKSYARELGGGDKKKESFWSLLEARKILRSRHGRIYVQFDRPISLAALTGGRRAGGDGNGEGNGTAEDKRRAFVQSLANRIAYGINRASTITPVGLCAAALLSGTEAVGGAELAWRIALLRRIALEGGGRMPAALASGSLDPAQKGGAGDGDGPVAEALRFLHRDGLIEIAGAAEQRHLRRAPFPARRARLLSQQRGASLRRLRDRRGGARRPPAGEPRRGTYARGRHPLAVAAVQAGVHVPRRRRLRDDLRRDPAGDGHARAWRGTGGERSRPRRGLPIPDGATLRRRLSHRRRQPHNVGRGRQAVICAERPAARGRRGHRGSGRTRGGIEGDAGERDRMAGRRRGVRDDGRGGRLCPPARRARMARVARTRAGVRHRPLPSPPSIPVTPA